MRYIYWFSVFGLRFSAADRRSQPNDCLRQGAHCASFGEKPFAFPRTLFPAYASKAGSFADTPLNSHGLRNSKKLPSPPFEAAHPGSAGASGTFRGPPLRHSNARALGCSAFHDCARGRFYLISHLSSLISFFTLVLLCGYLGFLFFPKAAGRGKIYPGRRLSLPVVCFETDHFFGGCRQTI